MRLQTLWIKDFKNLRDFHIDFESESHTTVLVGRNGTGKSNLLEALILIFRDLDLGEEPSFTYRIEYICAEHTVEIDADPERPKERIKIWPIDSTHPFDEMDEKAMMLLHES